MSIKEMTPTERVQAAISLQKSDRVPVVPFGATFTAPLSNLSLPDFFADRAKAVGALRATWDRFGGWDSVYHASLFTTDDVGMALTFPMKMKIPGRDLPATSGHQLVEEEIMTVEDYDIAINKGFNAIAFEMAKRVRPGVTDEQLMGKIGETRANLMELIAFAKEKGAHFFRSGGLAHPFDWFSMARSLNQVLMDLYRRPDKFAAASRAIIEDMTAAALKAADATGVRCIFMAAVRSNCTFVSPKLFEKYLYPSYKEIVERLWAHHVVTILHCDSNNDLNIKFFAELPEGSCILHTDGFTDLRKAKQILGNRICLMGDVPATLFTLGSPDQVYDYCTRLIQDVGKDGGFILSSGCEVPTNVKPENFEAFLKAAREIRPA